MNGRELLVVIGRRGIGLVGAMTFAFGENGLSTRNAGPRGKTSLMRDLPRRNQSR
jgi:hypothetical protein